MTKKTATKKPAKRRSDEDFATLAFRVVEQATVEKLAPKKKAAR